MFMEHRTQYGTAIDLESSSTLPNVYVLASVVESNSEYSMAIRNNMLYTLDLVHSKGAEERPNARTPSSCTMVSGGAKVRCSHTGMIRELTRSHIAAIVLLELVWRPAQTLPFGDCPLSCKEALCWLRVKRISNCISRHESASRLDFRIFQQGLGQEYAKHALWNGCRCMLIASRNPHVSTQRLKQQAIQDAAVWIVKADFAQAASIHDVLIWAYENLPYVQEFAHSAGVITVKPLQDMQPTDLWAVCGTKVTWLNSIGFVGGQTST